MRAGTMFLSFPATSRCLGCSRYSINGRVVRQVDRENQKPVLKGSRLG